MGVVTKANQPNVLKMMVTVEMKMQATMTIGEENGQRWPRVQTTNPPRPANLRVSFTSETAEGIKHGNRVVGQDGTKEHIYRRHALPIYCNRCGCVFKTDDSLLEHQRADEPCQKGDRSPMDGFDKQQEKLLRSRKRNQKSEVEKWVEVYTILFPNDSSESVPSPYYEFDNVDETSPLSPYSAGFARYQEFLRSELSGRVRQELVKEIEQELDISEERIRSKLPSILRIIQRTLAHVFQSSENPQEGPTEQRASAGCSQDILRVPIPVDLQELLAWDMPAVDDDLREFSTHDFNDFLSQDDVATYFPMMADSQTPKPDSGHYSMARKVPEQQFEPTDDEFGYPMAPCPQSTYPDYDMDTLLAEPTYSHRTLVSRH
ncbi:MAG: hypothetical protein M1822_004072 [Bathelium mastoideum]|nr:MAG: hypothetical protein M1822_004072 [Bathelium mastoideum]